jgi:hypothetical protein
VGSPGGLASKIKASVSASSTIILPFRLSSFQVVLGRAFAGTFTALAGFFDKSIWFHFERSYVDLAVFNILSVFLCRQKQESSAVALPASVLFHLAR